MELCKGLNDSAKQIYENNKAQGFWDGERNVGEILMLIVSELGEAMEAHRKGKFCEVVDLDYFLDTEELTGELTGESKMNFFKNNIKDSFEDEISDAVIRILDFCGGNGIDIEGHINAKVEFNKSRPKMHGKLY